MQEGLSFVITLCQKDSANAERSFGTSYNQLVLFIWIYSVSEIPQCLFENVWADFDFEA